MKFAGLVKVEDIREQSGIPVKIKLLLLHVIVITHLQEGGREEKRVKERKDGVAKEGWVEIVNEKIKNDIEMKGKTIGRERRKFIV